MGGPFGSHVHRGRFLVDYFAYGEGIFVALALLVGLVAVLALFSGSR